MNATYEKLSIIDPAERVLLLSYCLRPSQTCPGKLDKKGLNCPDSCQEACVVGRLRREALALGYQGVCIAAGGSMALRFVKELNPRGIVAVACHKELTEGVEAVQAMAGSEREAPAIAVVPLSTDGCVDTTVDEARVQEIIALGCEARDGEKGSGGCAPSIIDNHRSQPAGRSRRSR